MLKHKRLALLATCMTIGLGLFTSAGPALAEDCLGTLPDANCTLDQNTNGALSIGNAILTVSAGFLAPTELIIDHTINGKNGIEQGSITTAGNGGTIIQQADLADVWGLSSLTINTGDSWYVSGGADINNVNVNINGGTFGVAPNSAVSLVSAGITGSANDDAIDYVSNGFSYGTTGFLGRAGEILNLGSGNDRIIYYQSGGSMILVDTIQLLNGDDLMGIIGSGQFFTGNFAAGNGDDVIAFYSGSDAIFGSSAGSIIVMGTGNDVIDFDSGVGVAAGTISAALLDMGGDDDIINMVENSKIEINGSFSAGSGNDTVTFGSGTGALFYVSGAFDMGDGDDILQFNSHSYAAGVNGLFVSGGTFTMGAGADQIILTSQGGLFTNSTVDLGADDDAILFLSNAGNDLISMKSGSGFIAVDGGAGYDAIYFGSGDSVEFGDSTGAASITNVELIDVGNGTISYYGSIDGSAEIIQFTSATFSGAGETVAATITDGAADSTLTFSSGVTYSSTANLGDGNDTLIFSSAILTGRVNLEDGVDSFFTGNDTEISGIVDGGNNVGDNVTFTSGRTRLTGQIRNFNTALLYGSAILEITDGASIQVDLVGNPGSLVQFGSGGSTDYTYNLTNTIDGASLQILGDTVDTNGVDFGQTTALRGLTVDEGALFIIDSNVDASGDTLDIDGTLRLRTTGSLQALNYSSNNGTLVFEVDYDSGTATTSIGQITFGGGQTIDFSSASGSGDTFSFVLSSTTDPLVTDAVTFISAPAGVVVAPEDGNIQGNTILYEFDVANVGADTLQLTVTQTNTIDDLADSTNNQTIAEVILEDLINSTDPGIVGVRDSILASADGDEFNSKLEAASPIVNRAEVVGINTLNRRTFGLINQRLAMLRKDTGADTGVSTGNLSDELEVWWQVFAASGDQDEKNGISGYESTTFGMATGIDKELFEDAFFGLSFAWGETDANSKGAGDADTQVDSYQLSVYGDYDFGRAYINGMASYAYNDIATAKIGPAGERTANFHANHVSARGELGYAFMPGRTRIIPHLMTQYSYYSPESYYEEGPGAMQITGDSVKTWDVGGGVNLQWLIKNEEASYFVPELRLGYRYDLAAEPLVQTAQFTTSGVPVGPVFELEGFQPAEQSFDIGLGMTYFSENAWELIFNYDFELQEDYMAHAGMVRASYKFYP